MSPCLPTRYDLLWPAVPSSEADYILLPSGSIPDLSMTMTLTPEQLQEVNDQVAIWSENNWGQQHRDPLWPLPRVIQFSLIDCPAMTMIWVKMFQTISKLRLLHNFVQTDPNDDTMYLSLKDGNLSVFLLGQKLQMPSL